MFNYVGNSWENHDELQCPTCYIPLVFRGVGYNYNHPPQLQNFWRCTQCNSVYAGVANSIGQFSTQYPSHNSNSINTDSRLMNLESDVNQIKNSQWRVNELENKIRGHETLQMETQKVNDHRLRHLETFLTEQNVRWKEVSSFDLKF